jgi:hypothetical protein
MAMRGRTAGLEGFPMRLVIALATTVIMSVAAVAGSNIELFELRERCAKYAAEVWTKDYGGKNPQGDLLTYEVHYNSRLNKCFFKPEATMLHVDDPIDQKKNDVVHWMKLIELLENKDYGAFAANTSFDQLQKGKWVVTVCTVQLSPELSEKLGYSTPQDATCETEDMWRLLVRKYYMEE